LQQNYFIFVVTRENLMADHKVGDIGAGKTVCRTGIKDAPYGVFMVAPASHVQKCALRDRMSPVALSSEQIKEYVLSYWNPRKEAEKAAETEQHPVVWVKES
jgi:hypothetical protein